MAKILIVDDSIVARMGVKSCIPKDQGHELSEAGNGTLAMELFHSLHPDVVFLDITMPDRNGLEVLQEMKNTTPDAVVIIMSADIQKQTQERAMALGAFSIIRKPPIREVIQAELAKATAFAGVSL